MRFLGYFNLFVTIIFTILTILYTYQMIYILISIWKRKVKPLPLAKKKHRFAVLISARNEAGVIGELLDSLHQQTYDHGYYDLYVVADNCTDQTAQVAKEHGAIVFERFDQEQKGKGYALNYLYHEICALKSADYYDAFMVFDADNIIDSHFIEEVNKTVDLGKFDALTTYRNSKNFAQNWLTAAYSIWFMHEARHLNYPRMLLGAQCMISGTGFVVSSKVMKQNHGWPYYLLTEDIQFSVDSTLKGLRIGYCDSAILYDEQPSTWKQSWNQRLRWAKGFYQIDRQYLGALAKGVFTMKKRHLACYDVLFTVAPAMLLTIVILMLVGWLFASAGLMPYYVRLVIQAEMLKTLLVVLGNMWLSLMAIAIVTVIMEWKRIEVKPMDKIKSVFLFPIYILSYMPIAIQALFAKVEWKPIQHYSRSQLQLKD